MPWLTRTGSSIRPGNCRGNKSHEKEVPDQEACRSKGGKGGRGFVWRGNCKLQIANCKLQIANWKKGLRPAQPRPPTTHQSLQQEVFSGHFRHSSRRDATRAVQPVW